MRGAKTFKKDNNDSPKEPNTAKNIEKIVLGKKKIQEWHSKLFFLRSFFEVRLIEVLNCKKACKMGYECFPAPRNAASRSHGEG